MQANISNIVHHFQGQPFFRKYSLKQYNMLIFSVEREEREREGEGLQYSRLEAKDIRQTYQNKKREAEYHKEYTQAPNL